MQHRWLVVCALALLAGCAAFASATTEQYNYSVELYGLSDLARPYILERAINVTFYGANSSVHLVCSPWLQGCISPIYIANQLTQEVMLKVPNTTLDGIYYSNITAVAGINQSVAPTRMIFSVNVTYRFPYTPHNHTNTTPRNKTFDSVTTPAKFSFKYNQMQLPIKFEIPDIKLKASPGLNISVAYDTWLSGPSRLNITQNVTVVAVNFSIPRVAIGKYQRWIKFKDIKHNRTKNISVSLEVSETDWDPGTIDIEDLPPDKLYEYLKGEILDLEAEWLNKYKKNITVINISEPTIIPYSQEYLSNLVLNGDPKVRKLVEKTWEYYSNMNQTSLEQWDACQADLAAAQRSQVDMANQTAETQSLAANVSMRNQMLEKQLAEYDKLHVKNGSFWWAMAGWFVLALGGGYFLIMLISERRSDYM